jgi:hypothetical protein
VDQDKPWINDWLGHGFLLWYFVFRLCSIARIYRGIIYHRFLKVLTVVAVAAIFSVVIHLKSNTHYHPRNLDPLHQIH